MKPNTEASARDAVIPFLDDTHARMNAATGRMVAALESAGYSPCDAIRITNEACREMWSIWSDLAQCVLNDTGRWIKSDWRILPKTTACYVIYVDNRAVYVGSAKNLRARFHGHQIDAGRICYRPFAGDKRTAFVKYRETESYEQAKQLEEKLVRRLKPEHNMVFFKRSRSHA